MQLDKGAVRVYLEDHHQDFLSFTLRDRKIEDSNMQGYIWNGRRVMNTNIKPGDRIELEDGVTLKYPVATMSFVTSDKEEAHDK